jgi:hypothetical protein
MKEEYKSKTSTSTNGEFWETYDGGIPLVSVQWVRKKIESRNSSNGVNSPRKNSSWSA